MLLLLFFNIALAILKCQDYDSHNAKQISVRGGKEINASFTYRISLIIAPDE